MNFSYWEQTSWLSGIDFAVIGSGIVGLNCALQLRKKHPRSKIVIFEKGLLPSGASTKNAGFACFGSASEIIEDLKTQSETEVISLINERVEGLNLLRNLLGDENIGFKNYGGYELFLEKDNDLYNKCNENLPYLNKLLKSSVLDQNDVFQVKNDPFGFKNVKNTLFFNRFEGQLNTGFMMKALINLAYQQNIDILNCAEITSFIVKNDQISLLLNEKQEFSAKKVFIATNGFAKQFLDEDVKPARAQVLVTKPIKNLKIKGTFHLDTGYYYFRNIENRILFGGGRNLDFTKEETSEFGFTEVVQAKLEDLLRSTILPNTNFEIEQRWSGIMGVGASKKPILKEIAPNVFCGIRLGGMGIAIGSSTGQKLAEFS